MRRTLRAAAAAVGILALATSASSEEGMWTFDNFPAERMRSELGWAPDRAWLDRVMAGTARLPGCSASNVTAQGLVLTNHHCVISCVTALSTAEANFIEHGFHGADARRGAPLPEHERAGADSARRRDAKHRDCDRGRCARDFRGRP